MFAFASHMYVNRRALALHHRSQASLPPSWEEERGAWQRGFCSNLLTVAKWTNFGILKFVLSYEALGNITTEITLRFREK